MLWQKGKGVREMDNTERKVVIKDVLKDVNTLSTIIMNTAVDLYDRKADDELIKLLTDLTVLATEYNKKSRLQTQHSKQRRWDPPHRYL